MYKKVLTRVCTRRVRFLEEAQAVTAFSLLHGSVEVLERCVFYVARPVYLKSLLPSFNVDTSRVWNRIVS